MNKLVMLLTLILLIIVAGCSGTQDTVIGPDITDQPPADSMDTEIQKRSLPGPDQEGDPWDDRKGKGGHWNPPPPPPPPGDTL